MIESALLQLAVVVCLVGAGACGGMWLMRRWGREAPMTTTAVLVAERVQRMGRLVGLEVCAKEIATAKKGWGWMPPILLSQARLAMIFHFEKQYSLDLTKLRPRDVREVEPGRYEVRLPALEGTLRLRDVTPYDIQDGRVLGLLDVIQVDADAQRALMVEAQRQAANLYEDNESRYEAEARQSIERQLGSLLALFDVSVDVRWQSEGGHEAVPEPLTFPNGGRGQVDERPAASALQAAPA